MSVKHTHRLAVAAFIAIVLTTSVAAVGDEAPFDPFILLGEWSGSGMFVMPITGIEMAIEGKASFVYDSSGGYIRTGMIGTKVFYTYRDSGHLYVNPENDSLTWEVWDGFGRHVIYEGKAGSNILTGHRRHGNAVYSLRATMVSQDSLDFRLHYIDAKGRRVEKARFNLGRDR